MEHDMFNSREFHFLKAKKKKKHEGEDHVLKRWNVTAGLSNKI